VGLLKRFTRNSKKFEAARLRKLHRRFRFAKPKGKFNITLTTDQVVYKPIKVGEPYFNKVCRNPLHVKLRQVVIALRQRPPCLRLGLLLSFHAIAVLGTNVHTWSGFHTRKYILQVYLLGRVNHANGQLWRKFLRFAPKLGITT